MIYFGIGLAVAFGSLFLPVLVGSLMGRRNAGGVVISAILVSIGYGLFLGFCYWKVSFGIYGPVPFFFSILFGGLLGALIAGFQGEASGDSDKRDRYRNRSVNFSWKAASPGFLVFAGYILYGWFVLAFPSSDMMNAKEKAALFGKVETVTDLNKVITPADPAHICLVSENMARNKANVALSKFKTVDGAIAGSRYEVGHPTKQYVDGQLWWVFPLEFQGWLKWKQDKQVAGYLRVSAENPFDEGQAVQFDKNGKEIHIHYLNSACFEHQAERHMRYNGYMGKILTDWTLEVDDNWRPYYTATVVERTMGTTGYKTTGVALLDIQTGEIVFHTLDKLPSWIDRGIPLDVIDTNTKKWGKYSVEGWWYTFWHNDKSQEPTKGWFLTYDQQGGCQWFSGFTSTNTKDTALTGFVTVNARTGAAKFHKATGVTEDVALRTAKSLWSNFKEYEPTELTPYNLYGILTYVIPMEYQGQFKGVSMVSLVNYEINGRGNTFEEAVSNYRATVAQSGSDRLIPGGGEKKLVRLQAAITHVGMPMTRGKDQVFVFTLAGAEKIFEASYSFSSPKVPFMKEGLTAVITYYDSGEPIVTCQSFDIPTIVISGKTPGQARYEDNKKSADKEKERIDKEQKQQTLTDSERLKKVDPEKLEKFLKEQEKENK